MLETRLNEPLNYKLREVSGGRLQRTMPRGSRVVAVVGGVAARAHHYRGVSTTTSALVSSRISRDNWERWAILRDVGRIRASSLLSTPSSQRATPRRNESAESSDRREIWRKPIITIAELLLTASLLTSFYWSSLTSSSSSSNICWYSRAYSLLPYPCSLHDPGFIGSHLRAKSNWFRPDKSVRLSHHSWSLGF